MFFISTMSGGGLSRAVEATATDARQDARRARTEVESLQFDIERLLMITEALWQILKEKHGYDDGELIQRVAEIDLRDSKLDGRVAPASPKSCPHCGRTLTKRRPTCLFCGKPVAPTPFER